MSIFSDREPTLGLVVEMYTKGSWYAAIVSQVLPNTDNGLVHVTLFHPISGALPYQQVPYWDEQAKDLNRPNSWRFIEKDEY